MKKRILEKYKDMESGNYEDLRECIDNAKMDSNIHVRVLITKDNSKLSMEFSNVNAKEIVEYTYEHAFCFCDDLKGICINLPVTEHFYQGEDDSFQVILNDKIEWSKVFILLYGSMTVQINFDFPKED